MKDDDEALEFETCDVWYHVICEDIPRPVYEYMINNEIGDQFHWYCKNCKRRCAKLFSNLRKHEIDQAEIINRVVIVEQGVAALKDNAT